MPQEVYDSLEEISLLLLQDDLEKARKQFNKDKARFKGESAKLFPSQLQILVPGNSAQQFELVDSVLYHVHRKTKKIEGRVVPCDNSWEQFVYHLIRFPEHPSRFADAMSKKLWIHRAYIDSFLANNKLDELGLNVVHIKNGKSCLPRAHLFRCYFGWYISLFPT